MNKRKAAIIDAEWERTVRSAYPFVRSLYQITRMMNEKMKSELNGALNGKFIKTKKR